MAMIVELFGLPGSGKTFLRKKLAKLDELKKNAAIDRHEAVKLCLQRKNTSLLASLFKKLPYSIWNRIIHKHYCLQELLDFSSEHIELMTLYQKELSESGASSQAIRTILGAFVNTCVERQLFEMYGYDDELILMDEGFFHRFFTLYGNLAISCTQEDIIRYVDLLPLVQRAIFIETPENVCIERIKKRSKFPVLLDSHDLRKTMSILHQGNIILGKLANELQNRSIPCYQYDGQSSDFESIAKFCVSSVH
jgi:dephospho-CoA kinase